MHENIIYNSEKFKSMIHYIISRCHTKDNFARIVWKSIMEVQ